MNPRGLVAKGEAAARLSGQGGRSAWPGAALLSLQGPPSKYVHSPVGTPTHRGLDGSVMVNRQLMTASSS